MSGEVNREAFVIPSDFSGKRADVAFSQLLSGLTRTQIKRLITEGFILLEGEPIKASKKLSGGEIFTLRLPAPQPIEAQPENIPVDIIHQDDDIVVVNKPAGMTVHPGAGAREGTLVNALLFNCGGLSGIGGRIRPGIVHRLDKETSGVMVAAKNDFSHQFLIGEFKSRRVTKRYVALVLGRMREESGVFCSPIGRHPTNRVRMSTLSKVGKEASTLWKVLRRYNGATLVEAVPKTGRTHQIRVHFAESGHPIIGDKVYGPRRQGPDLVGTISRSLGRQALHAEMLGFNHPRTGDCREFYSPLPDDVKGAIDLLEKIDYGMD